MPPKLLLADDSVTIQRVIELTFAGEDVSVLAVGDGEQAIARVQADRPDIVLADIAMPKRNGYDVAAFIKSRPELSHIPVLLLAGAFEPVDDARAQQAGCDGVLVKPFEPQHVIARVRELLAGAKGSPTRATADVPRPVERLASHRAFDPAQGRPFDAAQGKPAEAPRHDAPAPPGPSAAAGQLQPVVRPEQAHPQGPAPTPPAADADFDFGVANVPMQGAARGAADRSLDDYFDRLDAAFANLGGSAPAPSRDEGPFAHPVEQPALPALSERQRVEGPVAGIVEPPAAGAFERPTQLPRPSRSDRPVLDKDLDWFDEPTTINVPVERAEMVEPTIEPTVPAPIPHPAAPPREIAIPSSPVMSSVERPVLPALSERPRVERPPVAPADEPWYRPPPATFASPPPPAVNWPPGLPSTMIGAGPSTPIVTSPIQPPPVEPPELPPTISAQSSPPPQPSPEQSKTQPAGASTSSGTDRTVADAFTALLAVEQGEPGAVPVRLTVGPSKPEIDDSLIEEITQRVAERLGPGAVRDVVRDIVSKVAERVVREELDRLKSKTR